MESSDAEESPSRGAEALGLNAWKRAKEEPDLQTVGEPNQPVLKVKYWPRLAGVGTCELAQTVLSGAKKGGSLTAKRGCLEEDLKMIAEFLLRSAAEIASYGRTICLSPSHRGLQCQDLLYGHRPGKVKNFDDRI